MPSDSVASFLDRARENRLLPPDQVEDLAHSPDVPSDSLDALCDFLQARGSLTPFQADRIRAGQSDELSVAGYTVTGELGPCPGGTAVRVLHPSLRTPLVLRRLKADWLAPGGDFAAAVRRAQDASPVTHPHLAHLLDAGVFRDEPFAVLEPFPGADLEALVRDIGPMPTALACGFVREAALGLAAAHDRGLTHGGVRPANLHVGPLVASSRTKPDGTPIRRPAPGATAKLFELGLVPHPPGAEQPTPAGDIRDLGATLFFLLVGRPADGSPLNDLRPDVPNGVVSLVARTMAADPAARPTAAAVADRLAPFCAPVPVPPPPPPDTATSNILNEPVALAPTGPEPEPVMLTPAEPTPIPAGGWTVTAYHGPEHEGQPVFAFGAEANPFTAGEAGVPADPFKSDDTHKSPFAPSTTETPAVRRPSKRMTEVERRRLRMWLMIGNGLWIVALLLWLVLINQAGCFGTKPESGPKTHRK
jgi:eukaryotic-like serine/threonine-protein kinase